MFEAQLEGSVPGEAFDRSQVQNVSSPHLPRRRQSVIPVPVFASSPTRTLNSFILTYEEDAPLEPPKPKKQNER
eukprot:248501-Amphidinium_carterae.1